METVAPLTPQPDALGHDRTALHVAPCTAYRGTIYSRYSAAECRSILFYSIVVTLTESKTMQYYNAKVLYNHSPIFTAEIGEGWVSGVPPFTLPSTHSGHS